LESPETTVAPPPGAISGDGGFKRKNRELERDRIKREAVLRKMNSVSRKQIYTSSVSLRAPFLLWAPPLSGLVYILLRLIYIIRAR
jgi:hypothetical protein